MLKLKNNIDESNHVVFI